MNLAEELKARGLVEHVSAPIEKILEKKRTVYFGADPSANSLHVGHLVPLLIMKRLSEDGHRIILLVGGGTGMIGDPKEKGERPLIDAKLVEANKKALKAQMQRVIGVKVDMVDNADWLLKIGLIEFLRDIGKHFTINELVKRDLIKRRLDDPDDSISYTEFAYSLLQGYDYLMLNQKKGADLQVGGSDQWTNILSGVELIRRKLQKESFAFTGPIVTDATGKKFGKSEGNAVWLDAEKTSPYAFYQFWLQLPDEGLETYFRIYSFIELSEIERIMREHSENPGARSAQRTLALAMTELVHGKTAANAAAAASDVLFGDTPLSDLNKEAVSVMLKEAPSLPILKRDLASGLSVLDVLATSTLAASKGDVRRLIEGNGISLNGTKVTVDQKLAETDFQNGLALLRKGKRDLLLLVLK